ncbi:gag-Pol polyprotein [Trichonephila clavipes]|nr:gag-Pol polyprotein [Trichonephila clavipes]
MLSRPVTQEEESFCEENNITIADMPTRSCEDMREAQLKDDNLKKIIDSFESPLKTEEYANWTEAWIFDESSQNLIPVYSPQSNPVERKNRDLKPRLAILVGDDHSSWYSKLPVIRFAMNTTVCDTTGHTPAYLLFGRELRTADDVVQDFKSVVHNDNFVAEITPYLKRFATVTEDIRERIETKQDQRKKQYDKNRRPVYYSPGDKVWVTLHPISSAKNKKTSKFMPKRDGPYLILTQKSPTSYVIASLANPSEPIATYHTSALTPVKDINTSPIAPLRKRGRPRKVTFTSQNEHVPSPSTSTTANYVSSPGRRRIHRGRL